VGKEGYVHRILAFATLVVLLSLSYTIATKADDAIRVGLVQMNARLYDKQYNLERAEELTREAAGRGAKIVCTPEAAVQGYARVDLPPGTSVDAPQVVAERARTVSCPVGFLRVNESSSRDGTMCSKLPSL
jgi:hypothetical protein